MQAGQILFICLLFCVKWDKIDLFAASYAAPEKDENFQDRKKGGIWMCGRYTLTASVNELEERFHAKASFPGSEYAKSYNVAPSQMVAAVISARGQYRLGFLKWGLIPSWAKDPKIGHKMINARSETVFQKPGFREAVKRRRCLIPANSFFEWNRKDGTRAPMRITLKNGGIFAMAGLWEKWTDQEGNPVFTCTILTTKANRMMAKIHDRMPVILRKEDEEKWLDSTVTEPGRLLPLLAQYDSDAMEMYAVSERVNSPKNNFPELLLPKN